MTSSNLMHTYSPLPVTFTHGEGAWLWDATGKKYLDAISGIAVTGLGHAHPEVSAAICEQANRLLHTSNLFQIELQQRLADKLIHLTGMDNVFFSNSGAEANEAAIKLARLYGRNKGIQQPNIVVTENSFHGRTLATLSASGNRKIQAGFEPLVSGFTRAPYNDIDALYNIARQDKNVVAILVEPIQGETGIVIPDAGYLSKIRELCDEFGWLMMLDEIQTGIGRSGQWFAFQHNNIKPDVMTLAKALGNGIPIGACIASGNAANTFQPGNHGSTFGGNPLACRTSLTVLEVIEKQKLVERAALLGPRILSALQQRLKNHKQVMEIRGMGLLLAIELKQSCQVLAQQALDIGIVINVANENKIRLLPPLIISDDEADLLVDKISQLIEGFTP